eukprot:scaffold2067_cov379-Prasinococcus_capsulatus_cf.AAC.3
MEGMAAQVLTALRPNIKHKDGLAEQELRPTAPVLRGASREHLVATRIPLRVIHGDFRLLQRRWAVSYSKQRSRSVVGPHTNRLTK